MWHRTCEHKTLTCTISTTLHKHNHCIKADNKVTNSQYQSKHIYVVPCVTNQEVHKQMVKIKVPTLRTEDIQVTNDQLIP